MKTKNLVDNFTNLYPVSKTLRFELRPIGRTQEYVERDGILDTDFHRAENYKKVKKIIDEYHKQFIEEALTEVQLQGLEEYFSLYQIAKRNDKQEKEFSKVQENLRKQIANCFTSHPKYKTLFKKELIKQDLVAFTQDDPEKQELVKEFSDFTTYFVGFYENRKNMYSAQDNSTAIAYRIIHQNLPKYIDNMKVFQVVQESAVKEQLDTLLTNLQRKVTISSLEEYFEIQGFGKVLTQKGIDLYNTILGAYSDENKVKVQGLNELINLHNQKVKKENGQKIPKMKPLFKQILSDREKISFIPEQFSSDQEVLDAVLEYYHILEQNVFENAEQITLRQLFQDTSSYNWKQIYIKNDSSITTISQHYLNDWSLVSDAIRANYDEKQTEKNKTTAKYAEKRTKELKKIGNYSIEELNSMVTDYTGKECHIEKWFQQEVDTLLNATMQKYEEAKDLLNNPYQGRKSLCKNDAAIAQIKDLLDAVKNIQWCLKPLISGQKEAVKDEMFYAELLRLWEQMDAVTLLYNRVRNYVTKKPYSLEKVKLNFNKSTLLDGWDKNKETDNLGIILRKNELYYLGIINKKCTKVIEQAPEATSDDIFEKMEYKLLPGPNKMLPKVFFSKSRIEEFAPSKELLEHYHAGTHTKNKGADFNINDCHELIDFFKKSIENHEDWSQFDFSFSPTDTYEDISGFYREVEHQGYKITFRNIDVSYIDELVENGQLYLFQIYNKDFSPYSKGTPNLHTMYWKALFSPENLNNVVYKLNGQAEVFFRKASIAEEDIISHDANVPVKNKDLNTKKEVSVFPYDIIKDKRFTVDKYQFHVPITMNFQAPGENYLNRKVNRLIHDTRDMHIIGIDRGERNLLYLTLIDSNGKIIKQMSLNQIISYDKNKQEHTKDYHSLLDAREKENKSARQNWKTVNTIKELKEGYLSQVIHVITELMIEYNAIVVLEDLNFGFMRGRQKVEKQVYQKFEKMLIEKLNYLVNKSKEPEEMGGLLHAYQLTGKFESFQKLGKQSGFLYYVPAWNTSKLDPTTGFVNLFYTKYKSIEETRKFIMNFDSIIYNSKQDYFEFAFDYSNFTSKAEGSQLQWTLCSYGERIENYRNPEKNNEWDVRTLKLTQEWKKLLQDFQITPTSEDMRKKMIEIADAKFYKQFLHLFSLLLQMRNSNKETREDKLCSPVLNRHGNFFESGCEEDMPLDADANGAYNIARKGLWIIEQIQNTEIDKLDKIKLAISNKEWLQYAQEHTL